MARQDMPIRRKLMLIILLISVVVMLLMRGAFFTYEYLAFRQTTLRHLSTLGEILAANSTAALAFDNTDDAREILAALKAERHVVAAALYDRNGRLFSHYPDNLPPAALPATPGASGYRFADARLTGYQPVLQGHRPLGTLYLAFDTGIILREWIWDSLQIALVVMAVVLLVAYLLSRVLQKQISQPILALAGTARAISERRDYSVRADKLGNDELGLLTDAFNQLLVQIHAQKTALDEHAIVAITDHQGRITYVNDKFCSISKYSREELLGQDHRIINSGHHPKEFIRGLWTTIAQGRVWHGELKNRAKDGTIYWVDTTIVPFLKPDGKPYEYVAIRADITQSKQAQAEIHLLNQNLEKRVVERTAQLETANTDLQRSRAELRSLFESIDEGYCIIEMLFDGRDQPVDYRFLTINPAFEKHTGLVGAQGRRMRELAPQHEAHWFETYGRIALTGEPARFQNYAEALHRWFDVYAFRYGDPGKRQVAILFTDITGRKQRDEQIRQLNADLLQRAAQLESANRELEAFSYSVSHDLRAPLRHVDGFANLLQKNSAATLNEQGRRYLATISDSARRMGRLIDDLLSFSRMGRGALQPREVEDHDALVASIIREGRWGRPDRPIEWRITPLPGVRADQAMLQQVWANLIENAVKYSGKVPRPCIEIGGRTDPDTGEGVFFVRDNGAGFDMRYADKLFGVFQRLHGATEFEGTGIGLANVRRIITRHGGRTWAEGAPGQGATFYFSLPATPTPVPV